MTGKRSGGRASAFPWLDEHARFPFPSPESASPDGIVCIGGNLSPGMLLSAYSQGIFPWFNAEDPLLWWSPDPRFALLPEELHVSDTMRKIIKKGRYRLSLDHSFEAVLRGCSSVPRPGQSGTWITDDMIEGYLRLHALGYAHSVEAWEGDALAGGLYGIALGSAFFGESMFSLAPDASKAAFIPLVWRLKDEGFTLIDSQVRTKHVSSMGGRDLSRREYLERLERALEAPTLRGSWAQLLPGFPSSAGMRALGAH